MLISQNRIGCAGHMIVRTEPSGLSAARRHISTVSRQLDLDEDEASDILLAVGEAISNAYRHGTPAPRSGFIYLDWLYTDGVFTVSVRDDGTGVSRGIFKPFASQAKPGAGCGLRIMCETVDELSLEFDAGTRVILKKRRA